RKVRRSQADPLAGHCANMGPDRSINVKGGEGIPLVRTFGGNAKCLEGERTDCGAYRRLDFIEVAVGAQGDPMGEREMRDAEDARQARLHWIPGNLLRPNHADAPGERINAANAEVFEHKSEVSDQPILKIWAVSALQCQFMIVNDGAAHVVR